MKQHWLLAAILVAVVAAGSYGTLRYLEPPTVTVVSPTFGPAVQAVYATGTVEPVIMIPIAPRIGARIVTLLVEEGDTVRKGQVLARLESDDLRNNLAQLEAQEDFARRDYLRSAALAREGIIARQTYDRAKANFEAARAAAAATRAQIGYMTLTAPNDGRVIRRDGEVGQFLPINQPLFWVSCLSPLRITADVDEEDIALVHVGQQVLVRADAFPGRVFHAHVRALTPKGDPVARSYRIRIVPDDTTPLQIGMTAEVNIITAEKQRALLVPSSAVTNNAVWILDRGKLQKRAVHVGIRGTDRFEIVAGLTVHDQIVETPPANAREGMRAVPVARRP